MKKIYETALPEQYAQRTVLDAKSVKLGLLLNAAGLVLLVIILLAGFQLIVPDGFSFIDLFLQPDAIIASLVLLVSLLAYIVLHELVHGLMFHLFTHQKLKFGLSVSCAYCGVPGIFTYRSYYLWVGIMPFLVFLPVFLLPIFFLPLLWKFVFLLLLATHVCGCTGDLYVTLLLLFKYKGADTLINDTGAVMTIYTPKTDRAASAHTA